MDGDYELGGRRAYHALAASVTALFGCLIALQSYTPLLPLIMETLGMSFTEAGLLPLSQALVYAALQVPAGFAVDRWGARVMISMGAVGVGVFSILFAFSPNLAWAVLSRALIGLALAGVVVPGFVLVGRWFTARRRGLAIGFFGMSEGAALIVGYIAPLMALSIGWRASIASLSLIAIMAGVVAYIFVADPPLGAQGGPPRAHNPREDLHLVFKPDSVLLGINQFGRYGVLATFLVWIPTYLYTDKGIPLAAAGLALTVGGIATLPSNIVSGWISDRMGDRVTIVSATWAAMIASVPLLITLREYGALLGVIVLVMWLSNMQRSPLFAAIPELFGPGAAGLLTGVHNMWANIGATILPLLLGVIRDATGSFELGWMALSLLSVLMLASSIFLRIRVRRRAATPS